MVFKVMPRLIYDATREYEKEKEAINQAKSKQPGPGEPR